MLNLVATTDKLQLTTSTAAVLHVHTSGIDYVQSPESATPWRQNTAISTATTTDIVGAPAASTFRNVKRISLHNTDVIACDVILVFDQNGTDYKMKAETLNPGDELIYMTGSGWQHFNAQGALLTSASLADPRVIVKALLADQSNSTVTPTEVTGITVPMGVGKWAFQYNIRYNSGLTTTGVRFSANHDGTVTHFIFNRRWVAAINTTSSDAPSQAMVAGLGGVVSAFSARAKTTAGTGTTLSTDSAGADMMEIIEGMCEVTVAGNLELWHGSEVAAISTVKQGTVLTAWRE